MAAVWMLPAEAARLLGVSSSGIRWMCDMRRLQCVRTPSGVRLVMMRDVERLRQWREERTKASVTRQG